MRILPAVLLLMIACTQPGPVPAASQPQPSTSSSGPRVILPNGSVIVVEVVADDESRAQGLMYRDHLDPAAGMLFLFGEDQRHSFWMKNTRIPLDMIFIDANRRIVGIERDVPPCKVQDCPSYGPDADSRYVLELAGGVAKQHGLKDGDVLRFEGTDAVAIR
jgi:uncharacterized membrane protein (UPF0127 family)